MGRSSLPVLVKSSPYPGAVTKGQELEIIYFFRGPRMAWACSHQVPRLGLRPPTKEIIMPYGPGTYGKKRGRPTKKKKKSKKKKKKKKKG